MLSVKASYLARPVCLAAAWAKLPDKHLSKRTKSNISCMQSCRSGQKSTGGTAALRTCQAKSMGEKELPGVLISEVGGAFGVLESHVEFLKKHFNLITMKEFHKNKETLRDKIKSIFVFERRPLIDRELLENLPKLKVIGNSGVGVNHLDLKLISSFGVKVTNTPHAVSDSTADIGMALMLASARRLVEGCCIATSPHTKDFAVDWLGVEVSRATLGIIGMGNIGYKVAKRAKAFDMTILYHNRNRRKEEEEQAVGAIYCKNIEDLLQQSDFVMLVVNLIPETHKLIGKRELGLMKPSATLINISRGAVVDQDALVAALQNGIIRAAALDVTDPEPLPRDHLLLQLKNVIITPHIGTATAQALHMMTEEAVENILAVLNGLPIPSEVMEESELPVLLVNEVGGALGVIEAHVPFLKKHFHLITMKEFLESKEYFKAKIKAIYVWWHKPVIDGELLKSLPNLKVIANSGVGMDHLDLKLISGFGVKMANAPYAVSTSTADIGMALLLTAARKLVEGCQIAISPYTEHLPINWLGDDISGATLGIIGMGSIGYKIAQRARAFEMKILYHNRNQRKEDEELVVGACYCKKIDDLLQQSDFVMLAVNLTPQTYKLIGKRELELMKSTATLINISRGPVIDQDALVEALQTGVIKGAALDVTYPEPLPRDHPLLKLKNVIITPHLGSKTHKTTYMITVEVVENILAALRGLPMPSEVFPD